MSRDTHLYIYRDQEYFHAYTWWGEDEVVLFAENTWADGTNVNVTQISLTKDEARELYESLGEHLNG